VAHGGEAVAEDMTGRLFGDAGFTRPGQQSGPEAVGVHERWRPAFQLSNPQL